MAREIVVLIHIVTVFYMIGGLGAVMVPLWRGWREQDLQRQSEAFDSARNGYAAGLLPGTIAALVAGFVAIGVEGLNPVTTGWLLAKIALHVFVLFVCLPLLNAGLQRVRFATTQAVEAGNVTDDLQVALSDNVPRVFGGLVTIIFVLMAALAVLKPF